jgi:hypothetical protein
MKILRYVICGCFNEEEKKTDHKIELRLNIFRRVPLKGTEHLETGTKVRCLKRKKQLGLSSHA